MDSRSDAPGSENMRDRESEERAARRRDRADVYLAMFIGFLIGVLVMLLLGLGMYGRGSLVLGPIPTPAPQVCPATPDLGLVCPTQQTCPTAVACPPTATPPPTADRPATATAACFVFRSRFPGTPCPK